jgi:hypothetical protein
MSRWFIRLSRTLALCALAVLATGGALAGTAGPALAAYSDAPVAIGTSTFGLVWHATPAAALSALDAALPNVGVSSILADTNHPMLACTSAVLAALPINPTAGTRLCWDSGDQTTSAWNPQGLTSSGDADGDGAWGANQVILSGWNYDTSGSRYDDARVAFIDANDLSAATYRWVYLVAPNSTGSTFTAAKTHVGGMVWYGDKLLVSGRSGGEAIEVFGLTHLLKVSTSDSTTIGNSGGTWSAYGYQYVMAEIGYYTYSHAGTCGDGTDDTAPLCFSALSLDRSTSPDSLVTTEYLAGAPGGRLVRYPFGPDYLLDTGSGSTVAASEAYRSSVGNMQGVLSWNGTWWLAHSSATYHGQLWRSQAGQTGVSKTCTTPDPDTAMCWSLHPEALSYWYSTGQVWADTEWPGQRLLFEVPLSALP